MNGVDPSLARAVAEGTYVVDAHAVAAAMLDRRAEARRLSRVLEAAQLDGRSVWPEDDEPAAGADVA